MKAIVCTKYGSPDVLDLREVEKPVPADNQVLVRVDAAALNAADWHLLEGKPFIARLMFGIGLRKPKRKIPGTDMAGVVEAIGRNVGQFKPGDEVFGSAPGAFAEYACAREDLLVLKPSNVSFEEAATVPVAGITALQGLRKGQIQKGQKVLINGASGGVGTFAVQLAKSFGTEVTAVCSTRNLEIARKIGAEHVIDYTHEDFTKNGQNYDLIVAINGYRFILDYRRLLSQTGTWVSIGGSRPLTQLMQASFLGPLISRTGSKKMISMGIARLNHEDLAFLKELLEAGKIRPVIDRRYPISETADAFRYFEEGHARGKVVIST